MAIAEAIKKSPPVVEVTSTPETTAKRRETLKFRVKSAGSGIGEVRVFHNGKLMKSDGRYRTRVWLEKERIEDLNTKAIYSQLPGMVMFARAAPSPMASRPKSDIYEGTMEIEPMPSSNPIAVVLGLIF